MFRGKHETGTVTTKLSQFRRGTDWLFGYDYFISYAWDDGRGYAIELHRQLENSGFNCFLDSSDFVKGGSINEQGKRALKKTSRLVVVATPKSLESDYVLLEVKNFTQLSRSVIPIGFKSTFSRKSDSPLLGYLNADKLRINETDDALVNGPSPHVTEELRASFNLMRQEEKRVRWFAATALLFLSLAILAGWLGYSANQQKKVAETAAVTGFVRTIGASDGSAPSTEEAQALWELAAIPKSSHRIRERIVDVWISDTAAYLRATRGKGRGKRAAIGIDYELYSQFQRNQVGVAQVLGKRLASPLSEKELAELNSALLDLSEGWDPETTLPVIAEIKKSIRESPKDILYVNEIESLKARVSAIGMLSRKLSPTRAGAEAVDLLKVILTSGFDSQDSWQFLTSYRLLLDDHIDAESKRKIAEILFPHITGDHGYETSFLLMIGGAFRDCCSELEADEAFEMATAILTTLRVADDSFSIDLADILYELHDPLTPVDSIRLNKRILQEMKRDLKSPKKEAVYREALVWQDDSIADEEIYAWIKPFLDDLTVSEHLDLIASLPWKMSEKTWASTPEFTNRIIEMLFSALENRLPAKEIAMAGDGLANLSQFLTKSDRTRALSILESAVDDVGLEETRSMRWAIDEIKGIPADEGEPAEKLKSENQADLFRYLSDPNTTDSKDIIIFMLVEGGWRIRTREDVEVARILLNEILNIENEDDLADYEDAFFEVSEGTPSALARAIAEFTVEIVSGSTPNRSGLYVHDQNYSLAKVIGKLGKQSTNRDRLHLFETTLTEMEKGENLDVIQGLGYTLQFLSEEPSSDFALPALAMLSSAMRAESERLSVTDFTEAFRELSAILEFAEMESEIEFLIQKVKDGDGLVCSALSPVAKKIPSSLVTEGLFGYIDSKKRRAYTMYQAPSSQLWAVKSFLEFAESGVKREVITYLVKSISTESVSPEGDPAFLSDAGFVLASLSQAFDGDDSLTNFAVSQMLTHTVEGSVVPHDPLNEDYRLGLLRKYCSDQSSQKLAEFLKWPVCVGAAEKIALAEMERKLSKERGERVVFDGKISRFLKSAESLGILRIKEPAKRPRAERALDTLTKLFAEKSS